MRHPLPEFFRRQDESDDALFYAQPRLVTHIDDEAIAAVTRLYRETLPEGGAILDLMSSWISHLPGEARYRRVAGLGMNRDELAANPRLDHRVVQDLNRNPRLPFEDSVFDAATICVSIDYLTRPVEVLRELGRVVRAGGPVVITFSNRCFPTKAILPWLSLDDAGHLRLVADMLAQADNWDHIEMLDRSPNPGRSDPLFAVVGRSRGTNTPHPA
ncbi:MAG: methyltransferase domain-containing protein [Planctomycetes bacterium]|nr:methyltransferase domain-containing protein [Planctomycetota bacterium]